MTWETRGNRRYYYRKVRVGDKVQSIYVGNEEAASPAVYRDMQRREQEKQKLADFKNRKTSIVAQLNEINIACADFDLLIRASLLVAGLKRDAAGIWRTHSANKARK